MAFGFSGPTNDILFQMLGRPILREDILNIETNLDCIEKGSLVFLLCDDATCALDIIIKNITNGKQINSCSGDINLTVRNHNNVPGEILSDSQNINNVVKDIIQWANRNEKCDFGNKFLEALCLLRQGRLLEQLGCEGPFIELEQFMNKVIEDCNNIMPIKKALFHVCNELSKEEFNQLIELVMQDFSASKSQLPENYGPYMMEANILNWIYQDYITVGRESICDISALAENLKKIQRKDLAAELELVQNKFNEKLNLQFDTQFGDNLESNLLGSERTLKNLKPGSLVNGQQKKNEECYSMDPQHMGICVIVNQQHFTKSSHFPHADLEARDGSNFDRDLIVITFEGFGYTTIVLEDQNVLQLESNIKSIIRSKVDHKHSSFVLCLLSHGIEGSIYSSDGVPVEVDKIKSWFLGDLCPKLLGKPKIMIIQACQGKGKQLAMYYEDDCELDGISDTSVICPPTADVIKFWASVPGYLSMRNPNQGSWFIQILCKQLLQQGHIAHLKDIFTSVKREVSERCTPTFEVMMPESTDTFRKNIYLPYIPEKRKFAAKFIIEWHLFQQLLENYRKRFHLHLYYSKKLKEKEGTNMTVEEEQDDDDKEEKMSS